MRILILFFTLLTVNSFAHDHHDWRHDYLGYLNLRYEPAPLYSKRLTEVPEKPAIDMEYFKENLAILAGFKTLPGGSDRINERGSTSGLDKARAFLKKHYEDLGFQVSFQKFGRGINIIAEKKGTTNPNKVLILSSHIDSVGNSGANDDGTGTIGALTIAKELSLRSFDKTIRIIGFDREESWLQGSKAYVDTLSSDEEIIGDIQIEMMGVNKRKDGKFHVIDCDKENSLFLSQAIRESIQELALNLSIVKTCTSRSDHGSFWKKKLPAIVLSENFFGGDADPCYHEKCDIFDERLDFSYMEKIMQAVSKAVQKLAN